MPNPPAYFRVARRVPYPPRLGGCSWLRWLGIEHSLRRYRSSWKRERKLKMASRFDTWLERQLYTLGLRREYCRIASKLCAFFGNTLFHLEPLDIGEFWQHASTSRWIGERFGAYLGALRHFFEFPYLGGVVARNPELRYRGEGIRKECRPNAHGLQFPNLDSLARTTLQNQRFRVC